MHKAKQTIPWFSYALIEMQFVKLHEISDNGHRQKRLNVYRTKEESNPYMFFKTRFFAGCSDLINVTIVMATV